MTSRGPYWCPKTMKRRPYWCPKPVLWELNSFLMQTLSFVSINLHRCWSREWKHSIAFFRSRCRCRRRILSSPLCPSNGKVLRTRTSSLHLDQPSPFRWWPVLCISFKGSIFPQISTCHFLVLKLRYCFHIWGLFSVCNMPKMRFPPFTV